MIFIERIYTNLFCLMHISQRWIDFNEEILQ